jgi:glycosyltransferase involved in cell wall biosynthesis
MVTGSRRDSTLGSAVFVGTARNCAAYLPAALERWSQLNHLFSCCHLIVAENDSTDATKEILAAWTAGNTRRSVLWLDGCASPGESRSAVLAKVRNRLLDEIVAHQELRNSDFLVVMDLDDASLAITPSRVRQCMCFEGWDALFANQLFYYYDIWALRDDVRSVDDFLERIEAAPAGWRRKVARLRHLTWRNRPISPFRRPIRVKSAFGGFGIYRMEVALRSRYIGWRNGRSICEHVPFNETLSEAGARLFIHPGLINMLPTSLYRAIRTWL